MARKIREGETEWEGVEKMMKFNQGVMITMDEDMGEELTRVM